MNWAKLRESTTLRWSAVLALGITLGCIFIPPIITSDRQKKLDEAPIDELKAAVKNDSNDLDAKFALAFKLYQTEDYAKALELMRETVRRAPRNGRYWSGVGRCEGSVGNAREAIFAYRKAVELDPKQIGSLADSGQVLYESGLYTEALNEWDRARKIDPQVHLNQEIYGAALNRKGRGQEAWDVLLDSINKLPMQDSIYDKLTETGIGLKKFDEVEFYLLKRMNAVQTYPIASFQIDFVKSTLARPRTDATLKEALKWAIDATQDMNQKAISYALLAEIQMLRSHRSEAVKALESARKLDPKDSDYLRVKEKLFPNTKLTDLSPEALALQRLDAHNQKEPETSLEQRKLIDILIKSRRYSEASELCHKILDREPENKEISALQKDCEINALKALSEVAKLKLKVDAPF